ncbi:hypothetical protein EXIGLDRAFT_842064 [Exidia glandulosa HHB12029]|uniref:F-box domain-containing protein n=1 Tax=Exidia glandulosa HHB12029 TaxID=1314781 RepID=A0A165DIL3_EXIGL|nr:hypothetical protein EXIGLDRAFT_842064 [Exidia glandulosa HHB12029]
MIPALPLELWCMAWTWLPLDDRVSVSQVCCSWRYFSLGTSQLWSRIDVYSSGLPDPGCACAGCSCGDEDAPTPSFLPADYSCCLRNTNLCSVVLALQRCGTQPILLSIEGLTAEDYVLASGAAYDSDDESDHTIRCLVKILAPYIPRISWMHFLPRDYKAFTKFLYLCLRYCPSEDCTYFDSMRELILSSPYDEDNMNDIDIPWLEVFGLAFHRLERIKLGFGCYWALHADDWQPFELEPEDGPLEFLPELKELHYTYYEPRNCVDVLAGFPGLSSAHLTCDCDCGVDSDTESDAWGDISSLRMRAAHVPVIHITRIQDEETARLVSTIFGGTDRQELVLRYEEIEPWSQLYDIFADLGTELNVTVSLGAKTLTIHAQDAARVRTVEMPITGDGVTHRAIWTSISPSLVRRLAIPLNVWYITVPVLASLPVLDCLILRFVGSRDREMASRQRFVCATTMPALRVLVLQGYSHQSYPYAFDVSQSVVEKIALSLNSDDRHGGSRLSCLRVLNLEVVGFDPEAVARATGASVQQMWDYSYSISSDVFFLGDDDGSEYSLALA